VFVIDLASRRVQLLGCTPITGLLRDVKYVWTVGVSSRQLRR
jgi:hypothetical protein